jgi:hypothetical protein
LVGVTDVLDARALGAPGSGASAAARCQTMPMAARAAPKKRGTARQPKRVAMSGVSMAASVLEQCGPVCISRRHSARREGESVAVQPRFMTEIAGKFGDWRDPTR